MSEVRSFVVQPHLLSCCPQPGPGRQVGQPEIGGFQTIHDGELSIDSLHHALKSDPVVKYTYILSLPTLATFAIGNAAIKYKEGFIYLPGYGSRCHFILGL